MARYLLLWVHGPWIAASLMVILAMRLLLAEDFSLHGHGWGLLGSASICSCSSFKVGVAKKPERGMGFKFYS